MEEHVDLFRWPISLQYFKLNEINNNEWGVLKYDIKHIVQVTFIVRLKDCTNELHYIIFEGKRMLWHFKHDKIMKNNSGVLRHVFYGLR